MEVPSDRAVVTSATELWVAADAASRAGLAPDRHRGNVADAIAPLDPSKRTDVSRVTV